MLIVLYVTFSYSHLLSKSQMLSSFRNMGAKLSLFTERWVPDAWVICMILTAVAVLLSIFGAGATVEEAVLAWGDGVWNLLGLAMQFTIAMVAASACVFSRPVLSTESGKTNSSSFASWSFLTHHGLSQLGTLSSLLRSIYTIYPPEKPKGGCTGPHMCVLYRTWHRLARRPFRICASHSSDSR